MSVFHMMTPKVPGKEVSLRVMRWRWRWWRTDHCSVNVWLAVAWCFTIPSTCFVEILVHPDCSMWTFQEIHNILWFASSKPKMRRCPWENIECIQYIHSGVIFQGVRWKNFNFTFSTSIIRYIIQFYIYVCVSMYIYVFIFRDPSPPPNTAEDTSQGHQVIPWPAG